MNVLNRFEIFDVARQPSQNLPPFCAPGFNPFDIRNYNEINEGEAGEDAKEGDAGEDANEGEAGEDANEGEAGEDAKEGQAGEDANEGQDGINKI